MNYVNEQSENPKNVLTAFAGLTFIAVIAWMLGSQFLAIALDLGGMLALFVTTLRNHSTPMRKVSTHSRS